MVRCHNTLQHTATHCNTVPNTVTQCNIPTPDCRNGCIVDYGPLPQYTATYCHTLQHTAKHCGTLQQTATHNSQRGSVHRRGYKVLRQHTATHCNTLQHAATHCNSNEGVSTGEALDFRNGYIVGYGPLPQHAATLPVPQHTTPHCNTLWCSL